jgi:Cu2+-containing amine oxidase
LEANDDLKGSKAFKQNVKLQVNKTSNILESVYQEGFNAIYNNNPEMCTNVLNKIDSLMHSIKTASIDELVMIEALVKQYKENKEEINKTQITEFTKLD